MIFKDRPRRAGPQTAVPHRAVGWLQRRWAALLRIGTPRLNTINIVAELVTRRSQSRRISNRGALLHADCRTASARHRLARKEWKALKANAILIVLAMGTLMTVSACQASLPVAVDGRPLPSLAPMLERVTPAVVNISTRTLIRIDENPLLSDPFFRYFFDLPKRSRKRESQSLGSGVIVDAAKGYILTNHHVVDKADEITVTLKDGRKLTARPIGSDPETDIAIIQVPPEGLASVTLADSDTLRVGDFVVAIGNPFGLGQTVTSGIVSGLGRSGLGIEGYENFIQTDASINPGNSGGALVNLRGELVGINTAILAPNGGNVGIGFAIPVNMAKSVMQQLIKFGEVRRGIFGVRVQNVTPDVAQALGLPNRHGAVIVQVEHGSPAAKAGLKVGDLVVGANGRSVRSATELRNTIGLMRAGSRFTLDVVRKGRTLELSGVIADPYADYVDGAEFDPAFKGALFGEVEDTTAFGRYQAVKIGTVRKGSPAWENGLRPGDTVIAVNKSSIRSLSDLRRIVRRSGGISLVKLRRGGRTILLVSQ